MIHLSTDHLVAHLPCRCEVLRRIYMHSTNPTQEICATVDHADHTRQHRATATPTISGIDYLSALKDLEHGLWERSVDDLHDLSQVLNTCLRNPSNRHAHRNKTPPGQSRREKHGAPTVYLQHYWQIEDGIDSISLRLHAQRLSLEHHSSGKRKSTRFVHALVSYREAPYQQVNPSINTEH